MTISLEITTILFGMLFLIGSGFRFGRQKRLREIADFALIPTDEEIAERLASQKRSEAARIEKTKRDRHTEMVAEFVAEQAPKVAAAKARRAALAEQTAK
ncbi:hypothetical protein [Neorhizobium sp. NCHU2750]|uniref:hypothetical protein n=1 Tax=Neorhizobium sp. NCHU2750 TaxID=1825976 RepID=UPI000E72DCBC